jgi:RNA-binding protein 39
MVQQLPRGCVRQDLINHFQESCGKVIDVKIIADRNNPGRSKGIAYVEFDEIEAVAKALAMNGGKCVAAAEGRKAPLIITPTGSEKNRQAALAEKEQKAGGPSRISVQNMPITLTSEQLHSLFESFAEADKSKIKNCEVLMDAEGNSTGCGFIEFETSVCAQMAVSEMNNIEIADRTIRVSLAAQVITDTLPNMLQVIANASTGVPTMGPAPSMPGLPPGMAPPAGMPPGMAPPPGMPPGMAPPVPPVGMGPPPGQGLMMQPGGGRMPPINPALLGGPLGMYPPQGMYPPGMYPPPGMPPGNPNVKKPTLTSVSRTALMANLLNQPTTQFVLRNMFDPATETDEEWAADIRDEVLEEASTLGAVVHIFLDDKSVGDVYLKFADIGACQAAQLKMHNREFGGKTVLAEYMADAAYAAKFPDSANATTPLAVA